MNTAVDRYSDFRESEFHNHSHHIADYMSPGESDTTPLKMHQKKTSKTTVPTKTTEEYASRSSIHGIGYTFDRDLGIFDRVLLLLVVFVFLGVAGALTWNLWTQWRDE